MHVGRKSNTAILKTNAAAAAVSSEVESVETGVAVDVGRDAGTRAGVQSRRCDVVVTHRRERDVCARLRRVGRDLCVWVRPAASDNNTTKPFAFATVVVVRVRAAYSEFLKTSAFIYPIRFTRCFVLLFWFFFSTLDNRDSGGARRFP